MTENKFTCERCGAPAVVHIGHDPEYGNVIRDFCMKCAIAVEQEHRRPGKGLNLPAIVVSSGITILLLSAFADALAFGQAPGFGWKQDLGLIVGGCLAIVGAVAVVRTVLADWLQFGNGEGFGRHQLLGTVIGVLLIFVGVAWFKRSRTSGSSKEAPSHDNLRWGKPSLQAAGWESGEPRASRSPSREKRDPAAPTQQASPASSEK